MGDDLTADEQAELQSYIEQTEFPKKQESNQLVALFNKVFRTKDTTKGANLQENEIEAVRILKATSMYAGTQKLEEVSEFINQLSENVLGTSLSRKAKFLELAVSTRKHISTESRSGEGGKRSWLGKKKED